MEQREDGVERKWSRKWMEQRKELGEDEAKKRFSGEIEKIVE